MKSTILAFAAANLAALVSAHGKIISPTPRAPGQAMASACGQQMFNNQNADPYGNIQGELQVTNGQSDYNAAACNVWVCKGYKYEDNTDKVQTYSVGDVVPMQFDIRAPHDGVANVSIVTSAGAAVSQPLISWSPFASNAVPIQQDQLQFSITIPDVGDACSSPGACMIQHFWDARSIDQTYESCVDVVIGGSSSGGKPPVNSSSSALPSSTLPTVSPSSASAPVSSSSSLSLSASAPASASAAPTLSTPSLPISSNSTSTKKPCGKKPTGTGSLPTGVFPTGGFPVGTGFPSTLSTVAVPTSSAPTIPSEAPSSSATAGAGAGASSGDSSIDQLIALILQLIEQLAGQNSS